MAAFSNEPMRPWNWPGEYEPVTRITYGPYQILVVRGSTTGYCDNYHHLDNLIRDFARHAERLVRTVGQLATICGHRRVRTSGRDYKTPAGVRPFWLQPQAPQQDLPCPVSLPRWREFARRRA